jgi:hypothetical protein
MSVCPSLAGATPRFVASKVPQLPARKQVCQYPVNMTPGDRQPGAGHRPRVLIARWPTPARIDIDSEHESLAWSGGARSALIRARPDMYEELLAGFVSLGDAPDEELLKFARRWGMLGHHDLGNYPDLLDRAEEPRDHLVAALAGLTQWTRHGREPMAAWRCWSHHARALLRVSAALREGRVGRPEDVSMLCHPSPTAYTWPDTAGLQPSWLRQPDYSPSPHTLRNQRELVEVFVERWIRIGHVRPVLRWTASARAIELFGRGLMGALAVSLLAAVQGATSLAVCSGCANLYVPDRTPRETQRHFCGRCRDDGEPLRQAKRDSRARARAWALARQGWSTTRIATMLSRSEDTVDIWLARQPRRRPRRESGRDRARQERP